MTSEEPKKTCRVCTQEMSVNFFFKSPRNAGGYATICKGCNKRETADWKANNKDRVRAYRKRAYLKTPAEIRNKYQNERQKAAAARLVTSYVKKAIVHGTSLKYCDVTNELVELKRQQLEINRLLRALKKAAHESSKDSR